MRRFSLQFAAASALTAFSIVTAFAHATLETDEASPGGYKAVIRVPHGCDGKATDTVRIEIPEGFINAKPMPKPGWALDIETGDYAQSYDYHGRPLASGTRAVIWSGGNLPDAYYDEFVVNGTLDKSTEGRTLSFVTVQKCGADQVAWDETAAPGQDPHALDRPAPTLKVVAGGDAHSHHGAQAGAHVVTAGHIDIEGYWARAMLPGQKAGGGYLTLVNNGETADRLVGVASAAADKAEIHSMEVVDDVMTMRPVEGGLEIPPGGTVELEPGGYHLMFMGVGEPFAEGGKVPVTLSFEHAGSVELTLPVRSAGGGGQHDH